MKYSLRIKKLESEIEVAPDELLKILKELNSNTSTWRWRSKKRHFFILSNCKTIRDTYDSNSKSEQEKIRVSETLLIKWLLIIKVC
jgi:hypothetical protein